MMTDTPLLLPQEMVDPTTLNPHPRNAKLHDEDLLVGSVAKGLYRAIVVNRGTLTGRPNEILSGHGTTAAWIEAHPGELLQVSYVDVDEQRATEILLTSNPGPHDPGYDEHLLTVLLSSAEDLTYTGFNGEDLSALLTRLGDTILPGPGGGAPQDPTPPDEFGEYGETIQVTFGCPSCGYEWSGRPHPNAPAPTHTPSDDAADF